MCQLLTLVCIYMSYDAWCGGGAYPISFRVHYTWRSSIYDRETKSCIEPRRSDVLTSQLTASYHLSPKMEKLAGKLFTLYWLIWPDFLRWTLAFPDWSIIIHSPWGHCLPSKSSIGTLELLRINEVFFFIWFLTVGWNQCTHTTHLSVLSRTLTILRVFREPTFILQA